MPNTNDHKSDKPSLEELLRFKRAEQPDEAFWERFDTDLHQRMLQTLVKKDPWLVQLMRGLSGRLAQTAAVGAAAAVMALFVVRPALDTLDESHSAALAEAQAEAPAESNQIPADNASAEFAAADYAIDVVSADDVRPGAGVTQEFHLDSIQVASYDAEVYSTDSATHSPTAFASAGVALVF